MFNETSPLPAPQHDFWMSCASDIVQLYGEYFQSLSPSSGVATCCNLDGVEVSTSQLLSRSSAPLPTSWMLSMRGCQSSVPRSVVISAHSESHSSRCSLPEVPAQPSPFSGAVSGVPDRLDQRPQSPSTNGVVVHSLPAAPPQPSPFSRSASSVQGLICLFQCHSLCRRFQSLLRPSRSRVLCCARCTST